jgi:mannitol/fructose-specific phosphotransferase system IIA component (Ntr-type)
LPHSLDRIAVVQAARRLNSEARILVRARYLREREDLEQAGATAAVFEEAEAAVALARLVLADTGVHRELVERKVRDLRLQLILENMSNIRSQRVRNVMVPWTRVQRLSVGASRENVLRQIAAHRFTRWPVTEPRSGAVVGYLLSKDLIAQSPQGDDWNSLIRPLHVVRSDDDIESTLTRMQADAATVCVVEEAGAPVGLVTLEDMLEQVVGRIEDEYPHEQAVSLREALAAGAVLPELSARTREEAIAELAAAIPAERLPPGANVAERALAREQEVSTDLGVGVAIPHARCDGLAAPLVVFGRSSQGIAFSPESSEPVRLIFLLVTPDERPGLQLALLVQLAQLAGDAALRERLRTAGSAAEIAEMIPVADGGAQHPPDAADVRPLL